MRLQTAFGRSRLINPGPSRMLAPTVANIQLPSSDTNHVNQEPQASTSSSSITPVPITIHLQQLRFEAPTSTFIQRLRNIAPQQQNSQPLPSNIPMNPGPSRILVPTVPNTQLPSTGMSNANHESRQEPQASSTSNPLRPSIFGVMRQRTRLSNPGPSRILTPSVAITQRSPVQVPSGSTNSTITTPIRSELTEIQKQAIEQLKRSNLNQRNRLTYEIQFQILECMICSDFIGWNEGVWNCSSCHHILHFECVEKWANTSLSVSPELAEMGWKCVACQTLYRDIPSGVICFCGKVKDPESKAGYLAHSCGRVCGILRDCGHRCKIYCHPGPCDSCKENVIVHCNCGRKSTITACRNRALKFSCNIVCGTKLQYLFCNCM